MQCLWFSVLPHFCSDSLWQQPPLGKLLLLAYNGYSADAKERLGMGTIRLDENSPEYQLIRGYREQIRAIRLLCERSLAGSSPRSKERQLAAAILSMMGVGISPNPTASPNALVITKHESASNAGKKNRLQNSSGTMTNHIDGKIARNAT